MSDVRDDRSGADVDVEPSGAPAADSTWVSAVRGPGAPTPAPAPGAAPVPAPAREPFDARAGLGPEPATPPMPAPPAPSSRTRTRPAAAPEPPPARAPRSGRPPAGRTGAGAGPGLTGERSRRRTRRARRARREAARRAQQAARAAAPRRRHRILPRTVIGISLLLLAFGLGTAASGVALFMYYQDKTDSSIAATKDFSARVDQSIAAIEAEGNNARAQVQSELEPLRKLAATGETLGTVMNAAGPSVWEVRTFGVDGAPLIASAFVVASDADKSFLVSAFTPLQAATRRPGPAVTIGKNGRTIPAELWTWDEANDLALLIVEEGNLPKLEWADPDGIRLGDQLFAVSGLGAKGAAVTQGFVADVSSKGLQHTAPIGSTFEGGPLLTADAKVAAVATLGYAPFGARSTGAVSMAPPIRAACSVVLRCPNGQVTSAGRQR